MNIGTVLGSFLMFKASDAKAAGWAWYAMDDASMWLAECIQSVCNAKAATHHAGIRRLRMQIQ